MDSFLTFKEILGRPSSLCVSLWQTWSFGQVALASGCASIAKELFCPLKPMDWNEQFQSYKGRLHKSARLFVVKDDG